ncbi:MAG: tRNA lysidine(34) synthetase TilS [Bianqueaceae bacterium]
MQVRTRRPGDYISAAGGRKKLKDYFIDEKIPRSERGQDSAAGGWLPHSVDHRYRLSDGCKIGEETKRVLEIDAEFPGAYI